MADTDRLDRFFEQSRPAIPDDAAERVLGALTDERVAERLYRGELERVARRASRWSAFFALVAAGTLVASLAHDQGPRFRWSLHEMPGGPPRHAPASAGTFAFVDERRLADPFAAGRK